MTPPATDQFDNLSFFRFAGNYAYKDEQSCIIDILIFVSKCGQREGNITTSNAHFKETLQLLLFSVISLQENPCSHHRSSAENLQRPLHIYLWLISFSYKKITEPCGPSGQSHCLFLLEHDTFALFPVTQCCGQHIMLHLATRDRP